MHVTTTTAVPHFCGQNNLFCGILFSLFSKIFEHEIFFSSVIEEVYSEVYHSLFKAIIFIIIL